MIPPAMREKFAIISAKACIYGNISAKKLINENQDDTIESVLAKELRVMILTGQSEELKQRLEKFVKEKN